MGSLLLWESGVVGAGWPSAIGYESATKRPHLRPALQPAFSSTLQPAVNHANGKKR